MCSSMFSQVQKKTKLNGTIEVRLMMFWETKTWNQEKMSWKKLSEKLICLNRYLFLVTQSPKKNVLRPGFVFSAVSALQSDDYIETCDIYLEKHLCRCYELLEHHKVYQCGQDLSMSGMRQHEAETSNKQSVTTSTLYVQSRSGSRCVRDR